MPGYVLDGVGQVELPRRPLAVTVDATDTPVEVVAFGPDGTECRRVLTPRPGLMILPRVDVETVVVARPSGGEAFPQGTVLLATIGVDSERDPDPERAELTPIDVSGLYSVELAAVAPAGERLSVTARKTAVDVVLSELAARARSAARGVLRADRLPEARRQSVEIDIDATMSMLPRIEDRSIRAVVDVVAGIVTVIGAHNGLEVNLIGRSVTRLPSVQLRDVADRMQAQLDRAGLGIGFRSACVDRSARAEPTLVITVTDSMPADRSCQGGAASVVRRHHVVLSTANAQSSAGVTVVAPPDTGVDVAESLLIDPAQLRRIVESLLGEVAAARNSEGAVK